MPEVQKAKKPPGGLWANQVAMKILVKALPGFRGFVLQFYPRDLLSIQVNLLKIDRER